MSWPFSDGKSLTRSRVGFLEADDGDHGDVMSKDDSVVSFHWCGVGDGEGVTLGDAPIGVGVGVGEGLCLGDDVGVGEAVGLAWLRYA